jgi:taurine dioxygenase
MLDVVDLAPDLAFGSLVTGLTLEQLSDEEVRGELRRLWFDRGVIVFRGGDETVEFQIRLSAVFGPLVRHHQNDRLVEGNPELLWLKSDPSNGITAEIDGRCVFGLLPWHGDARWLAEPPHGAVLRVHRMPTSGGETGFIDLISTYERLPPDLKQRIAGLEAVVRFSAEPDEIFRFHPRKVRVIDNGSNARSLADRPDFPPILQPLVYLQPETGRKVLGFTPMPRQDIVGLEREESDALLWELARYATDERHAYFHTWREGDLLLWDNLRMLHCALGVPPGDEREVWRTTLGPADYPIARPLEEGGFAWKSTAALP